MVKKVKNERVPKHLGTRIIFGVQTAKTFSIPMAVRKYGETLSLVDSFDKQLGWCGGGWYAKGQPDGIVDSLNEMVGVVTAPTQFTPFIETGDISGGYGF